MGLVILLPFRPSSPPLGLCRPGWPHHSAPRLYLRACTCHKCEFQGLRLWPVVPTSEWYPCAQTSCTVLNIWSTHTYRQCNTFNGAVQTDTKYIMAVFYASGSISDGIIEIFQWIYPSGRNMALGSTHPLTEMSTRGISWRLKAAGA